MTIIKGDGITKFYAALLGVVGCPGCESAMQRITNRTVDKVLEDWIQCNNPECVLFHVRFLSPRVRLEFIDE